MKNRAVIVTMLLPVLLVSCSKDNSAPISGIVTIDNTRTLGQTYYVYGFLFSEAKKVSTLETPKPDITVDSDGTNALFMTDNLKNSFYLQGEYQDEATAESAFAGLTSAVVPEPSWEGLALPLKANQIWIYRSGAETYAKLRIISLIAELRNGKDYAECTFEWEYQPDGTLTFPGK
jgi:hypothetical protein